MLRKAVKYIRDFLRANFFAGMFIAVPFAFTVSLLVFLWGKINKPLAQIFDVVITEEMPWSEIGAAIGESSYGRLLVPLVSALLVLLAVLILGILTRSIIGRMVLAGFEGALGRMPVVGMIYTSFKQFGEAFITGDGESKFQRVVAVQFPYKGCWAVGFVTGKADAFLPTLPGQPEGAAKIEMISVVIPSTPFPTTSFMVVVPESETITLDMPVKDALKLVISGGVINPGESNRLKKEGSMTRIIRETDSKLTRANSGTAKT